MTQKKTVLIVEDEPAMLQLLTETFTKEGYHVVSATDGEQGLLQAQKTKPDVMILDILLPKIDGIQVLQTIHSAAWGESIPIIILTNVDTTDKTLQAIIDTKASYYLIKANVTPQEILEKAKTLVDHPVHHEPTV